MINGLLKFKEGWISLSATVKLCFSCKLSASDEGRLTCVGNFSITGYHSHLNGFYNYFASQGAVIG